MDFWDLTKLLVRRWMIVLPLLILSAGLAVLVTTQVRAEFTATAYVQLVPPVITESDPDRATVDQRNPWIGLGTEALGNAAIVMVTDRQFVEELVLAGRSDSFTLTMNDRSPMVVFEVVGDSEGQARLTADQLIDRFTRSIATLQGADGVSASDLITARRLDLGSNVVKSTSKTKRAFVAVLGAGGLISIAVTIGIDAWLRWRRRRRSGQLPAKPSSQVVPGQKPPGQAPGQEGAAGAAPDVTVVLPVTMP
ncbi:MAG: hypothetical protein JXA67_05920 [Micromonosporaceae bacterium]|nr:hypothetical protein [Micromonosporaceae bacterium]